MKEFIFDEKKYAEDMIFDHKVDRSNINAYIFQLAKYNYFVENMDDDSNYHNIVDYLRKYCSMFAESDYCIKIEKIIKQVKKREYVKVNSIKIRQSELDFIKSLDNIRQEKLAFVLLCVAKYWDAVSDKNNHWVNSSDKDIMQMANINTSIQRQSLMFAELRNAGFIRFSKKIDNLNVQVCFMESGKTGMHIQDFRNLGYQYMKHYGGQYFECVNCGLTVKMQEPAKGRPQKYCPNCAVELHTRQIVNSVMRRRQTLKK